MKKRIQFIQQRKNEECRRFWQIIDCQQMITLEHVWKNIHQQLDLSLLNTKYKFYCNSTKQSLPEWYHVDLLNDNEKILIQEFNESPPINEPSLPLKSIIKPENLKIISKKKQLKVSLTNRSFFITNKHFVPTDFYRQWEDGKMHKTTRNCQMIF
ncbi:hypothetical protein I4U23_006677 [Adineta vaga]|nr:hypothetical protein I4U23_006677 [Adineta vaga]